MPRSKLALIIKLVVLMAAVGVSASPTQARQLPNAPVNLDFKQDKAGQEPTGWFMPPVVRETGYQVKVVPDTPQKEQNAVVMTFTGKKADANEQSGFGNLMQSFSAEKYRGKRVRFRAKVRCEAGKHPGRAMLWMRVDRPNSEPGFFDNMGNRPISSSIWQSYEISGEVAIDAQIINIGCMMLGGGKVWLTDVSLTAEESRELPPAPLTEQGRNNLIALAKLYGYIRFFHPSDEATKADWDKIAYAGVKAFEDAPNSKELAKRLEAFFRPIAPSLSVYSRPPNLRIFKYIVSDVVAPQKFRLVKWRHTGFGGGTIPAGQNLYSSKRDYADGTADKIPSGFSDPIGFLETDLLRDIAAWIPRSVYVENGHTYPKATEKLPALSEVLSGSDRNTRLADVIIAWNVFQHFYPYFDVVKTDWNQALVDALNAAATDKDERAFLDTLRRLVAALHDGHGYVSHPSETAYAPPPFSVGRIEGKLVVIAITEGAGNLKPGDVLLKLDGQDAETVYQKAEALISGATPQWIRHRALSSFLLGGEGTTLTVEAQRGDAAPFMVTVKHSVANKLLEPRPAKIAEIKPGIWYVDMDTRRAVTKDFLDALPKLEKAKGIIFDMRGYPNEMALAVLPHLTDKPITSANWNVPIITHPDRENWEWQTSNWGQIPPTKPRLKAKIAFLTYGGAISYAESIMGIVEHYKLGAIVGEATAGTNGNINPFVLPGGYRLIFTGMKVTKHDGSQHHGVGIKPTVPVERTIKGVTEKRDEVLDKAIELVSK